ncbi:3-deoxy-D-manno-octulosonic-acid transferase [Octadecabacter temperatus]|uniref:3-deoxy-D-manno-octulosonic acid transferase n=2 Tax=Octadecabacter temperatus TaxID=1458307 RepID=A0A0K0Y7D2_9RHOB|nr:3-deoxy-D-manno-octulosonic acid transferase [Octadecabacter temperatus]SIO22976.1 3-deoxy-D-manno-octulosonic-acid transferase [Octadecabacter temperatus]
MLKLVLGVGAVLSPLAQPLLKRRLAKGKEDPARWREKLGETSAIRPDGPLVWMHGVGVGEVMALRGLIEHLALERADLQFLVTSSARSSGEVFAQNLPTNTRHQYLPLDLPSPVEAFLDHWKPDLAVWSDQEIWPRMVVTCARRGIPQAYVAARIGKASAKAKARFGAAYGDLFRLLDARHAQDANSAKHMADLMDDNTPVAVTGSIKAAGAPLTFDPDVKNTFETIKNTRRMWLLASSHPADEAIALAAHKIICDTDPGALLIIAPRIITRAGEVVEHAQNHQLSASLRSINPTPDHATSVYIADTYGELGSWYRAASIALIGGTFDAVEGHNPWEAATLGAAILHGSRTSNFALDYEALTAVQGCRLVHNAEDLAAAVLDPGTLELRRGAIEARASMSRGAMQITNNLLSLLKV